jgi:methionine-rich copper-binding protein CopC/peroxiredoxin
MPSRGAPPVPGNPAPAWEGTTLSGSSLSLAALEGEVVVLNVWATWCAPCIRELPVLEALHRQYRDEGLRVGGVSVDRGAAREAVRSFVEALDITFTIALDPDQTVMNRFRILGVPETFPIGPDGIIAHRWIGEFDPMAPSDRSGWRPSYPWDLDHPHNRTNTQTVRNPKEAESMKSTVPMSLAGAAALFLLLVLAPSNLESLTPGILAAAPASSDGPGAADAAPHLRLNSTQPAADASVAESPAEIRLFFSEPPQMQGTSVRLADASGELVATTEAVADEGDAREVYIVPEGSLAPGAYTVHWRVIAQDGHAQRGEFGFRVTSGR